MTQTTNSIFIKVNYANGPELSYLNGQQIRINFRADGNMDIIPSKGDVLRNYPVDFNGRGDSYFIRTITSGLNMVSGELV